MSSVVVLDRGWGTTREAEHEALRLASGAGLPVTTACTHFAVDPPRVVVTVETPAPVPAGLGASGPGAHLLREAHVARRSGRLFVFSGAEDLPARLTVAELLAATAVDRVVALGGQEPSAGTVLRTQSFLRPEHVDGDVVLRVRPADGGAVVPFEQPSPTPCCADHD